MIRDILLPARLGNYYLFTTRILAIEITSLYVKGVLLVCSGTVKKIEKIVRIDIKEVTENSLVAALKKITLQVKTYDVLLCDTGVLPVIFKEITVPFIGKEKIDMVLGFEVESHLPFALTDTAYDSMVLSENKETNESTVLVACVQKEPLYEMLHAFEKAGCALEQVGVTLFGLYQTYKHLGFVQGLVLDFGVDVTTVLYFSAGSMKAMRQIPKGFKDALDAYNEQEHEIKLTYADMMQAVHEDETMQAAVTACKELYVTMVLPDVLFARSSFEKQLKTAWVPVQEIRMQGHVDESMVVQYQQAFELEQVVRVDMHMLEGIQKIEASAVEVYDLSLISMLLGNYYFEDVNVLQQFLQEQKYAHLSKQLFILLLLTTVTLGGVFGYSYYLLNKWQHAYSSSKNELDRALRSQMNISQLQINQNKQLVNLQNLAEETLKREKKLWFSFSAQAELTYLDYLYELSTTIDRQSLDLTVTRLDLSPEEVVLHGNVKDYDALKTFEEELLTLKNFTIVDVPRELTFIVKLKVKNVA